MPLHVMRRLKRKTLFSLALCLHAASGQAETLEEAWNAALAASPALAAQTQQVAAAQANTARALRFFRVMVKLLVMADALEACHPAHRQPSKVSPV